MATVLGSTLLVAQMGAPRTDRAFNRRDEGWETLAERYIATRHPDHLAELPRREGKEPALYGVGILTPEQYSAMQGRRGAERVYFVVRAAVSEIRLPGATPERPAHEKDKESGLMLAPLSWVSRLQELGGLTLVEELATIAERRAVIGDIDPDEGDEVADPLDRYALPPGVVLGR